MIQIKTFSQKYNPWWTRLILLLWTWIIPVVILTVIAIKVFDGSWLDHFLSSEDFKTIWLVVCVFLAPVNMLIEALKWQFLSATFEQRNLGSCLKIILSGRSLNVITPFGLGVALTKYLAVEEPQKRLSLGAEAISRVSQFFPTLIFGIVAAIYLVQVGMDLPHYIFWTAGVMLLVLGLMIVFLFIYQPNWLRRYFAFLNSENLPFLIKATAISFVRYAVFSLQFFLLFLWLDIALSPMIIIMGICWIFLIKTVVPNVSVLGDLLKRELSAVFYFQFFLVNLEAVTLANVMIWLINIVLPAIIGIAFVSELKERI
jgi:hypothetical protein